MAVTYHVIDALRSVWQDPSKGLVALAYHTTFNYLYNNIGFLGGSDGKESACNAGDQVRSLGWENPLEKGMATHSGILTQRIPWTEEPGGL